jgi:anti-sigma regulatory factor (Ser/Thr protein kinase)
LAFSTRALVHEREPIAQRFPSIESLLLSSFEKPDLDRAPNARTILTSMFTSLDEALAKPSDREKISGAELAAKLTVEAGSSLREQDLVNRVSRDRIQIFLPAILLPSDPDGGKPIRNPEELARILDRDPQLKVDLATSFAMTDDLEKLKETSVGEWHKPLQSYFVTRTGVVAAPPDTGQRAPLRSPTRVYFAERPYYWDTVKRGKEASEPFHVTYPYIDLVGKGVLFTVCHRLKSNLTSESIVCLDFRVEESALSDRLKPFQIMAPVEVSCDFEKQDHGERLEGELIGCDNQIVTDFVQTLNQEKKYDYLTGDVYVADHAVGLPSSSNQGLIYFTIPIGRTENKQKLLLYVIDPDQPQKSLLKYWSIFAFLLLSASISTGCSLFYGRQARRAERRAIFDDIYMKVHRTALGGMSAAKSEIEELIKELPPERDLAQANKAERLLQQAYEDSRHLLKLFVSQGKHEPVFDWTTDLKSEFEELAKKLRNERGTYIRISQTGQPYPLRPEVLDDIFTICSEALENASRHANSREGVDLTLDWTWRRLALEVRDKGCGFDIHQQGPANHFGLQIMRSVAGQMEAKFDLQSTLSVGTTVTLQVGTQWLLWYLLWQKIGHSK